MLVDLIIEDTRWDALGTLANTAATATLAQIGLSSADHEIALLACDDARIATLNTEFRGKPMPTNVLSWPEQDLAASDAGSTPPLPEAGSQGPDEGFLGDIAIAYDTCAREAAEQGKDFDAHVSHLVVHATLHLLGYDHIRDQDATLMEALEVEILGKLGIADPY